MRVHELAKELGVASKQLVANLKDLGVPVKTHMSVLDDSQMALARSALQKHQAEAVPESQAETGSAETTPPPTLEAMTSAQAVDPGPPVALEEPPPVEPAAREEPAPVEAVEQTGEEKAPSGTKDSDENKLVVRGSIVVRDFAVQLGLKPNQLIAELMRMNIFASINQRLELKIAQRLAKQHGYTLEHEKKVPERKPVQPVEKEPEEAEDLPEDMVNRPPVITFMGHVDHGKTSLLDSIRKTRQVDKESGGITQHIGASVIDYKGKHITFLDTPGHEAFTNMRARGADLTDIAVIVIAADDGIMPQTKEALQHAKAADVCIMVAINKIDLNTANPDRVKQQLQQEGFTTEDWGGDIISCEVSAETGAGVNQLLEMILLQAEVLELSANPKRRAWGHVIEACLESGRGPTATVLVQRGTLHRGDVMVCGSAWGKLKALMDGLGNNLKTASPSSAVKCMGLSEVPQAGAEFMVYANERVARRVAEARQAKEKEQDMNQPKRATLEDLLQAGADEDKVSSLPIILKADVQGSLEALEESLNAIKSNKVNIQFLLTGVGNITSNDVLLASASNAIVIGFHVGNENGVNAVAKKEGIEIRLYSVIYEVLQDVQEAMLGLLAPESKETVTGHAEILQVFDIGKQGKIAGCVVRDGRVHSNDRARLLRDSGVIFEGTVGSLKRFQNDASEVTAGQECGIWLDGYGDYAEGDIIEIYDVENVAQQL